LLGQASFSHRVAGIFAKSNVFPRIFTAHWAGTRFEPSGGGIWRTGNRWRHAQHGRGPDRDRDFFSNHEGAVPGQRGSIVRQAHTRQVCVGWAGGAARGEKPSTLAPTDARQVCLAGIDATRRGGGKRGKQRGSGAHKRAPPIWRARTDNYWHSKDPLSLAWGFFLGHNTGDEAGRERVRSWPRPWSDSPTQRKSLDGQLLSLVAEKENQRLRYEIVGALTKTKSQNWSPRMRVLLFATEKNQGRLAYCWEQTKKKGRQEERHAFL